MQSRIADATPTVMTSTPAKESLLVVSIADARCAFPISAVDEVVLAARIETLPGEPDVVMGVLDLRGAPVVVIDGQAVRGGVRDAASRHGPVRGAR